MPPSKEHLKEQIFCIRIRPQYHESASLFIGHREIVCSRFCGSISRAAARNGEEIYSQVSSARNIEASSNYRDHSDAQNNERRPGQNVNVISFQHLGKSNWFRSRNLIFFLEQLSSLLSPFKCRLGYGLSRGGFAVGASGDTAPPIGPKLSTGLAFKFKLFRF